MAKGKKTTLKAALSSQQSRLKKKQDAAHAAQHAEQKGKNAKVAQAKAKGKAVSKAPTMPFTATDRILLVGEGNFSFARALTVEPPTALEYLPARNITATAHDSEDDCYAKYPDAHAIVAVLREKGAEVIFGVDATRLEKYPVLRGRKFDKIVWNFPHAGKGITDQDRNILSNQLLLLGFLRSAASFLTSGPVPIVIKKKKPKSEESEDEGQDSASEGETSNSVTPRGSILITLRNVTPYTLWDLPKLAKSPPPPKRANEPPNPRYIQLRSFVFDRKVWKGYEHRMTKGERARGQGTTGVGGEDRMWQFCLKD